MMDVPFEKIQAFDAAMRKISADLGVLFICDKGWLIDIETKTAASIQIQPKGEEDSA